VTRTELSPDGVTFAYRGLDGLVRRTAIQFDPAPAQIDAGPRGLPPRPAAGAGLSLFFTVSCEDDPQQPIVAEKFLQRPQGVATRAARRDRPCRVGRDLE